MFVINVGVLRIQLKMVKNKKYGVGKKLRDELDKLNNTLYENIAIPQIMDKGSKAVADRADNTLYWTLENKPYTLEIADGLIYHLETRPNRWNRFWIKLLLGWEYKEI